MQDFNEYAKNYKPSNENSKQNVADMVTKLANKFDGKNTQDLIYAIYQEAKRGKKNGTLSNADIDNFATVLAPMLDDKQRKMLKKIVAELKKI
ncbi:MAG: hypothetical protein IJV99_03765 [Clostridia bacterium]|nr:hypothetical protein [Clostridia bacterium]